jgi:IS5 family transposase
MKPGIWRWYARRSAIEPIFGHLKSDNRLERNHLKGKDGDRMNAILAGCGFNLRKLLGAFFLLIFCRLNRLILGQTDDLRCQRAVDLSPVCAN